MSFSKLPIEIALEIIKALPYVRRIRKVEWGENLFTGRSMHPDYKTSLRLCSVCKSWYMLLTPAFYASTHFILVPAQIEPFLHTITSSAAFGKRLSTISHLAFEPNEEISGWRYVAVAKRVFKRLVGDGRNAAPPRDITAMTARHDLEWMVLATCTSPATLRGIPDNLPSLISPTIKRRLPLPTSWSRLSELEISFFVTPPLLPNTTALSAFDYISEFPPVPCLRQLQVSVATSRRYLIDYISNASNSSSVEGLRVEEQVYKRVRSVVSGTIVTRLKKIRPNDQALRT